MSVAIPFHLTDEEVVCELRRLTDTERSATAQLVAHLAVLDARGIHLSLGYSSLFAYCCEVLHLSEHEAYNRIEAARTARRFPQILGLLHDGALNLTSVRLLAPVLTAENHDRLLTAAAYRNKRDIEELIARERPRPDVPDSVRKLPAPRTAVYASATGAPVAAAEGAGASVAGPSVGAAVSPRPAAALCPQSSGTAMVAPLAPDRYEIRFTAPAAVCQKLRLARDLLRHAVPEGNTAEIIDRALTLLLEDLARRKFAAVQRPRGGQGPAAGSRQPSAEVKRAAYLRDGGRCAFVGRNGRRCNSQAFLEFHHLTPDAVGGRATVENIQLRCRRHNQHEAEVYFGPIQAARACVEEGRAQHPAEVRLVPGTSLGSEWLPEA